MLSLECLREHEESLRKLRVELAELRVEFKKNEQTLTDAISAKLLIINDLRKTPGVGYQATRETHIIHGWLVQYCDCKTKYSDLCNIILKYYSDRDEWKNVSDSAGLIKGIHNEICCRNIYGKSSIRTMKKLRDGVHHWILLFGTKTVSSRPERLRISLYKTDICWTISKCNTLLKKIQISIELDCRNIIVLLDGKRYAYPLCVNSRLCVDIKSGQSVEILSYQYQNKPLHMYIYSIHNKQRKDLYIEVVGLSLSELKRQIAEELNITNPNQLKIYLSISQQTDQNQVQVLNIHNETIWSQCKYSHGNKWISDGKLICFVSFKDLNLFQAQTVVITSDATMNAFEINLVATNVKLKTMNAFKIVVKAEIEAMWDMKQEYICMEEIKEWEIKESQLPLKYEVPIQYKNAYFQFKIYCFYVLFGMNVFDEALWSEYEQLKHPKRIDFKSPYVTSTDSNNNCRQCAHKSGDSMYINPKTLNCGWKLGKILHIEPNSRKVTIEYYFKGMYMLYNTHLNSEDIAEYTCIPFQAHMSTDNVYELLDVVYIGYKIDHRDLNGKFVHATVIDIQETNFKIHYDGYSSNYDCWSDCIENTNRFAFAGTISKRPAHRFRELQKGDYVNINPIHDDFAIGWKNGKIYKYDELSGQVCVVYELNREKCYYWAHLDCAQEIAQYVEITFMNWDEWKPESTTVKYEKQNVSLNSCGQEYENMYNVLVMNFIRRELLSNVSDISRQLICMYLGEMDNIQYIPGLLSWKWIVFVEFDRNMTEPYFVYTYMSIKQVMIHVLLLNNKDSNTDKKYRLFMEFNGCYQCIPYHKTVEQIMQPNCKYWIW